MLSSLSQQTSLLCVCLLPTLADGLGYQSTLTYLAAVAHWHRTMGFCNPAATCSNPCLQLILRGIWRVKARVPPRQVRHPITTSMLSRLCKSALHLTNGQDAVMFRAAMSLAFFGCLRVSEFTFPEQPGKRDSYPQLGDVLSLVLISRLPSPAVQDGPVLPWCPNCSHPLSPRSNMCLH